MRFILHPSALNAGDEVLELIDRLVDRAADEIHLLEVPDADLLMESRWYVGARQTRRRVLAKAVASPPRMRSPLESPHNKIGHVRNLDDARLAAKLAHTPLVILVEDRDSDGVFLGILVEECGSPELQRIWNINGDVTPKAIEIETAGGIDAMPQRIGRAAEDAAREGRPLRMFVFCDRDERWPGDTRNSADLQRIDEVCNANDVPCHVLRKRNAENYIPDTVFEAARDDPRNRGHVHRFQALLRRSKVQRDHFPVKDGMTPNERNEATAAGLYTTAEHADLILLETRLFPKRPRLYLQLVNTRRGSFDEPGLRERDGNGEIDVLLGGIAKEL